MQPYLGPPWTNSCQIWCVRVFHHVLLKYGHENAEMQKRKFDDVTLQYSIDISQWTHFVPTKCWHETSHWFTPVEDYVKFNRMIVNFWTAVICFLLKATSKLWLPKPVLMYHSRDSILFWFARIKNQFEWLPGNLKGGIGSLLDPCVNSMGRQSCWWSCMEVSYCTSGFYPINLCGLLKLPLLCV